MPPNAESETVELAILIYSNAPPTLFSSSVGTVRQLTTAYGPFLTNFPGNDGLESHRK